LQNHLIRSKRIVVHDYVTFFFTTTNHHMEHNVQSKGTGMKSDQSVKSPGRISLSSLMVLALAGGGVYMMATGRLGTCPSGGCPLSAAFAKMSSASATVSTPWSFPDARGGEFRSNELTGNVVVVAFWATWCPPCRKEIPELADIHQKYSERGVTVLGVSLDDDADPELVEKARKLGVNYPLARGYKSIPEIFGDVQSIPTIVVLDRKGHVAMRHVGYLSGAKLENEIQKLL
jgi:thiol-disulfide isomerase/thioredoxin